MLNIKDRNMQNNQVNHKIYIKENKVFFFRDEILEKVKQIISRYPEGKQKSALIPVLHIAQEENGGYLSVDVMDYVSGILGIQPIEVYEVVTFYTQFYLEKQGKYVIEVCQTGSCAICGGEEILDYLKEKLHISVGETTSDGLFTLKTVECLGGCGYAPIMQIDTEFYEFLDRAKIDSIIEHLRTKTNQGKEKSSTWAEKFC
jgi:NADH-quinone oxidoreductase subunit E